MTEAAGFDGHLPKEVVQERFDRLCALQEDISLERNRRMVGRVEEVIVEGASKKDPGKLTGRTRTNKLVHFAGIGMDAGSFATARVTEAHRHHLDGVAVGRRNPARVRVDLPVVSSSAGCGNCP
jgi:tRNA-2-methylthio-N6-dimethylallyladenosine synthase